MILSFGGKTPRDEGAVFVAANATVLGDVTLGKTARVTGNIQAATITMEKGCSVKGNITVS